MMGSLLGSSLLLACLWLLFSPWSASACQFTNQESPKSSGVVPSLESCEQVCRTDFKGSCQCYVLRKDLSPVPVRLQCSQTNASILLRDIDGLANCNLNLVELHVSNSNLTRLYHLPSGLYNVQELVLENTGIDLETLRESNELLKSLKILRISNENYTEVRSKKSDQLPLPELCSSATKPWCVWFVDSRDVVQWNGRTARAVIE